MLDNFRSVGRSSIQLTDAEENCLTGLKKGRPNLERDLWCGIEVGNKPIENVIILLNEPQ